MVKLFKADSMIEWDRRWKELEVGCLESEGIITVPLHKVKDLLETLDGIKVEKDALRVRRGDVRVVVNPIETVSFWIDKGIGYILVTRVDISWSSMVLICENGEVFIRVSMY